MSDDLGLDPSSIPKMLSVRFRVIQKLANWLLKDDACVYNFIEDLAQKVKSGEKVPTDTEAILLEHYYGHYILTILTASFLSEVSTPIIQFIDFFENQSKSKIHKRHEEMVSFVFLLMSKFLKNGGMGDGDKVTAGRLLGVDLEDESLHLCDEEVWLGPAADKFLKEAGLTRASKEVMPWMENVKAFYVELVKKARKYFKDALASKTLKYCSALDPTNCLTLELDILKKRFGYLAEKFPNIIPEIELPALNVEVALMKTLPKIEEHHDTSPEQFWHLLAQTDGGRRFRRLPKLAQALLTIYNSNSAAETDFSVQNSLVGDARRNQCSQGRLNARMLIKSNNFQLRKTCEPCIEREKEIEAGSLEIAEHAEEQDDAEDEENNNKERGGGKLRHCHCSLFRPSDELIHYMSTGQPARRYKADQAAKREEREKVQREKRLKREAQTTRRKKQLREALQRIRNIEKKAAEEKEAQKKKKERSHDQKKEKGRQVEESTGGKKEEEATKKRKKKQKEKEAKLARIDPFL